MVDGLGVHPRLTDVELYQLIGSVTADLVCVGHTHWPVDRRVGKQRVIDPGSVGNPVALDLRASYALVEPSEAGCEVELCLVANDIDGVIDAVTKSPFVR
jgi:predicted phosphodiesterase